MEPNIYLHHYPASPFSEKIRLMLGYLGVAWQSVEISSIMPRPLLMPLTGGYRKTPTLQIGANIHCDTAAITAALVRHTGNSSLYAPGFAAQRVAEWADTTLFRVTVALNFRPEAIAGLMSQLSAEEVAAFQADRAKLVGDAPLLSLPPADAMAALDSYLGQLDRSLTAPFVFGDAPSIADFSIYHCLWFIDNPANGQFIDPYPNVRDWLSRLAGFGHGSVSEASAADALAHAKASEPVLAGELTDVAPLRLPGVALGDVVTVTPTDYGQIPVAGRLVAATAAELVLERDDPDAGCLLTHFPSIGFSISLAQGALREAE